MKRKITLEINCGDTTCFSEPGLPCPWLMPSHMGLCWRCRIFDTDNEREEKDGWLVRAKECINAEKKKR
jgi:hypothetical protein